MEARDKSVPRPLGVTLLHVFLSPGNVDRSAGRGPAGGAPGVVVAGVGTPCPGAVSPGGGTLTRGSSRGSHGRRYM